MLQPSAVTMGCHQGVPQSGHDSDSESSEHEYVRVSKPARNAHGNDLHGTHSKLSSHIPLSARSFARKGNFPLNPVACDFQPLPNPALSQKPISFDRAVQHGKYRTTKVQIYKPQLRTPECTDSNDSPDDEECAPLSPRQRAHQHHRRTSSKIHQRFVCPLALSTVYTMWCTQ